MTLVVDIGNSRSKFAVFEKDNIVYTGTVCKVEDLKGKVPYKQSIKSIIFSSVKSKEQNDKIIKFLRTEYKNAYILEFEHNLDLPFINNYKDKQSIGLDRLAGMSGVITLFGNNILLIDAGTCITFDYLDGKNTYQGGSISLGFQTKYKALYNFTANLPLVENVKTVELCAKTTRDCIQSGVVNGTVFEMEKTIGAYKQKAKDLRVVLTGGDACFLHKTLNTTTILCENVVFYGLKKILDLNAKKN